MAWKFDSPLGKFCSGALAGQVDVARPNLGIHQLQLNSIAVEGRLFCVGRDATTTSEAADWPLRLADAYVRGNDLVATFNASDQWPFAPQLYWRADTMRAMEDVLGSLSLLVSVSTPRLDTLPRISAATQIQADQLLHVAPPSKCGDAQSLTTELERDLVLRPDGVGCLVWRLPGQQISYAEICPASDFYQVSLQREPGGTCSARWELISEFLEKGVIRRTRLQAAFLPRERDVELALACCQALADQPLPLTT